MQALTNIDIEIRNSDFWETERRESTVDLTKGCVHAPPSGSMWLGRVWLDRGVRIVGGAAVSCQDAITSGFTSASVHSRHAFGSLRANSYSHRFRFDSLLTTSSRCLRACVLQAQAVPAARPEVVLAPREPPARVASSVFAVARSACASWSSILHIRASVVGSVCVCLFARILRRVAPCFSCHCLFVGRRSRLGSRARCNRQRLDDRRGRVVDRVVVSPRSQSHRVAITTAPGSTTTRDRSRAFRHATWPLRFDIPVCERARGRLIARAARAVGLRGARRAGPILGAWRSH